MRRLCASWRCFPSDCWIFFFQAEDGIRDHCVTGVQTCALPIYAEMMDTEAVPAALQQPLVLRALEELKMLTQTDLERERYEARRKAQLDENTFVKVARLEGRDEGREQGREEGRERGEQIGIIRL